MPDSAESMPRPPLGSPASPESTGDAGVDTLLRPLAALSGEPPSAHAQVYAGLHEALLEALNTEPAGPASVPMPGTARGAS